MRKIIVMIIAVTVLLTGCFSEKKSVHDTVNENASSSSKQQAQSQPESTSQDANANKSLFEKGYYDYQGTISNHMPIKMSVYLLGKDIVGGYFYDSEMKEIQLQGKAGIKDIVLYEYDEAGKNTGVFKGTMNTVDKIEGTWISPDNKINYPFTLLLKSILPGAEYGKRYAVAGGTESEQTVENFVSNIQSYIVNDNKKQLAEQVKYPIVVKINDKATKIQNEDDFINYYDQIFHNDYKQVIRHASAKYLFANFKGIMFGTGLYNIWIATVTPIGDSSKLMITAINN